MSQVNRAAVLLLSTLPESHAMMIQSLRNRGVSVSVARSGRQVQRPLRSSPRVVVVDLVNGPALDPASIARVNAARDTSRVVGLHNGDLGRFAEELDELVMDGFCRAGEWTPIVEMAAGGRS